MRLFFSLLALVCLNSQLHARYNSQKLRAIVDSVFTQNPDMLGVSVHIESPELHISWSYACGSNGKPDPKRLNPDQPVLIASTTKTYIAATIIRLIEQGKLELQQPIRSLISIPSANVLNNAGYDLNAITVRHLLSHTSGIRDYVDEGYFTFIDQHKNHQWLREEQVARAAQLGAPLGKQGTLFHYADVNYVLLSEIIEHSTHKPFYTAVRELLCFKKNGLQATWFVQLEQQPEQVLPIAHQYVGRFAWNVPDLNPSWDLYGSGGIASNVSDMARFYQLLFNGKIIKNKGILKLMYTDVPPDLTTNYCLGIRKIKVHNVPGYNHGGGLGTDVTYFPERNTSIAIASIEADKRSIALLIRDLLLAQLMRDNDKT